MMTWRGLDRGRITSLVSEDRGKGCWVRVALRFMLLLGVNRGGNFVFFRTTLIVMDVVGKRVVVVIGV